MPMYLICSNGLERMPCRCTILIFVGGLLKKLWMSLYTISWLQVTGCTLLNTNTISSLARWPRWEICDQLLCIRGKNPFILKADRDEKERLLRVLNLRIFANLWFLKKYFELTLTKTICSLQIVTKRQTENLETIKTSADQFVDDVHKRLPKYEADEVINTDQSGIQLELHSTRTLSHKGEKITTGSVRSINATTHSYTIQPTTSLDGHLPSSLYLCLKEHKGYMSENIRSHLFKASNVVITCSSSGKPTTSLVEYWRDHVLLPSLGQRKKFLLISDCWGG